MIKLIAFDIDGTLFNDQKVVSEKTKKALIAACNKGITIMLASGRSIHGLRQLALRNGLPIEKMVLLAFNGATVTEGLSEDVLIDTPIDKAIAQRLIKDLKHYPVTLMVPHHQELAVEDLDGYLVRWEIETERFTGKVVEDLSTIDFEPNKLIITGSESVLNQIMAELALLYALEVSLVSTGPNNLDVAAVGIDKGTTLKRYCELKGIDRMEVMAFGDNYNDMTMIDYAGIGVAMGNAIREVKAIADRITGTNDEDGIASILNELL